MREIRTSGSMSGDGKRSVAAWRKLPRPSSGLREPPPPPPKMTQGVMTPPNPPSSPSTASLSGVARCWHSNAYFSLFSSLFFFDPPNRFVQIPRDLS
jgi:hypothetical protein